MKKHLLIAALAALALNSSLPAQANDADKTAHNVAAEANRDAKAAAREYDRTVDWVGRRLEGNAKTLERAGESISQFAKHLGRHRDQNK